MAAASAAEPLPVDGNVAVVGAGLAGLRAAETLRQEGFRGGIVLVGEEHHDPYDRPPLSKQVLAGTWPPERTVLADRDKLGSLEIDARLGHRAVSLDAEARRLHLDDGAVVEADGIILATGASPRRMPGTESNDGVLVLRTIDDSLELRRRVVEAGPGARVVVIGAGFIGSEVASTCHELGSKVDVVEMLETPLAPILGAGIGTIFAGLHEEHDVRLHVGTAVQAISATEDAGRASTAGRAGSVALSDGSSLPADVVVLGIGVTPSVAWLADSGLSVGDGVQCDARLFAAPGVVAAGDLARWPHPVIGRDVRIEHWQVAAEAGVAAARSLVRGDAAEAFDPVPYFWSDQYGVRIQMLGLPSPTDEVSVVSGDAESCRFVALYGSEGRLTAALAISRPRQLMAFRPLLAKGASWDEALALDLT